MFVAMNIIIFLIRNSSLHVDNFVQCFNILFPNIPIVFLYNSISKMYTKITKKKFIASVYVDEIDLCYFMMIKKIIDL